MKPAGRSVTYSDLTLNLTPQLAAGISYNDILLCARVKKNLNSLFLWSILTALCCEPVVCFQAAGSDTGQL